jgi:hypothetical protein
MPREHGIEPSLKQISDPCHSERSEDLCASERFLRGESAFSTFHQAGPL